MAGPTAPGSVQAIVFDLDGTLVETAPEIALAVGDALRRFDLPQPSAAQVRDWIGHGTRELLARALAQACGVSLERARGSELLRLLGPVYDHAYAGRCGTDSRLYPGVRDGLRALRARGKRLALVTNKETRYTDAVLDAHQLRGSFDAVICGDTLSSRKPDPAGVAQVLQRLGMAPTQALFVGDSAIDAATARAAGLPVWLLPWGYTMGQAVQACGADRVLESFEELLNL